jgi:hypothetical protein
VVVLNPFRTPNHQHPQLHHLQHQRSGGGGKDDIHSNIYSVLIYKNRWMIILNSWIENPILRMCYMMGIVMLLICLMMVGYEALRKFSNHVTHTYLLGPSTTFSRVGTETHQLPLDSYTPIGENQNMMDHEHLPPNIMLPEILYKTPPKVVPAAGVSTGSSSGSGSSSHAHSSDERRSGVRMRSKPKSKSSSSLTSSSSSSSQQPQQQRRMDDDEMVDEEDAGAITTTDRLSHDSSSATLRNTDDNVEQILRPKEIHSKLLGLATEDYRQSVIHEEQEQNYQGFGREGNKNNKDGTVTAITSGDNKDLSNEMDPMVVVVLPPRKGEDVVKLSNLTPPSDHQEDGITTLDEQPAPLLNDNHHTAPVIQPEPLVVMDDNNTTTTIVEERSRRLRHHVVAIPTNSLS